MGNPFCAASCILGTLKRDGTWMIVEPFANDKIEDNLNSLGTVSLTVSTMVCVPASLADNGLAQGALAGERQISQLVKNAGFNHFRRSIQTPFNLGFQAKS